MPAGSANMPIPKRAMIWPRAMVEAGMSKEKAKATAGSVPPRRADGHKEDLDELESSFRALCES